MKQVFELSKEDFRAALKEEMESIQFELFLSKYENVIVPIDIATCMLRCSDQTIYRYVKDNKLKCLPRSNYDTYKFSLRTLLEFIYFNNH